MTIEKINYQRTFNLGNYSSERIGVDININAGEDENAALDMAKKLVEDWHVKNNPQLYQDKTPDVPILPKQTPITSPIVTYGGTVRGEYKLPPLEEQIKSCKELKVLETYKFIVKGKPELETAYNNRLKELT